MRAERESSAGAKSEKRTGAGSHDASGNEELNLLFRTARQANVGVLFCFGASFFFFFSFSSKTIVLGWTF